MREKLHLLLEEVKVAMSSEHDLKSLGDLRVKYLGKKGEITSIMKLMGSLSEEERPKIGLVANEIRDKISSLIDDKEKQIGEALQNRKLLAEKIDVSLPSSFSYTGSYHPITKVVEMMEDVFISMGFKVAEGPEIDSVENNFDALNSPIDHPSRSESDTFYFNPELLLRTQTSTVQVRTMRAQTPPIKIIAPGRCFRKDELDATHSPMFHQIEGLVVDKGVNMKHLRGTLDMFVKEFFGANTITRFRPHFFPFTEPSGEVDVYMEKYDKYGNIIPNEGKWMEILGCGMVHPNVLRNCGIDPEIYSGFAFGMGIDRITMRKFEIDDIRLLFENDTRFLKQF